MDDLACVVCDLVVAILVSLEVNWIIHAVEYRVKVQQGTRGDWRSRLKPG